MSLTPGFDPRTVQPVASSYAGPQDVQRRHPQEDAEHSTLQTPVRTRQVRIPVATPIMAVLCPLVSLSGQQ
jgi:hypothetical protein